MKNYRMTDEGWVFNLNQSKINIEPAIEGSWTICINEKTWIRTSKQTLELKQFLIKRINSLSLLSQN